MEKRITGHTELIGLVATPIRHSKSPTMHNAAFRELGLDYAYLAFDVSRENIEDAIKGMKALDVRGWNVSMPYKSQMLEYVDQMTPVAKLCGAINTVINDHGKLTGTITDGTGYMRALKEEGVDIIGKKITIVGAGGAATAICMQAAIDGVKEIAIFNRDDEFYPRAKQNVQKILEHTQCIAHVHHLEDLKTLKQQIDESVLFINATNVGMGELEGQMVLPHIDYLHQGILVSDVIYMPEQTELLKQAKNKGLRTFNGLGMMLYQGAEAFQLWTGQQMPIDAVKKALNI